MRTIVYDEPGIKFCAPLPNDWHLPGLSLKRRLQEAGFEVFGEHETTADPKRDIAIYFDALLRPQHPPLHTKSLYISLEPPVVNPRFYDRIQGWPYNRILTFSRGHCDNRNVFWSPFPVPRHPRKVGSERNLERLCAISGNKFSAIPDEMYSVRRNVYLSLGSMLDLYGRGWENDYQVTSRVNYCGPCESNYETFQRYHTAISIENQYLEGYCSEKYWTPLQAGCKLQRIGWEPDYTLDDCDQEGWSKRIVKHVVEIA